MRILASHLRYGALVVEDDHVRIDERQVPYGDRLNASLESVIGRVQTRTRNARRDLEYFDSMGFFERMFALFDDMRTAIPISRPYREAIENARDLSYAGLQLNARGVELGDTLSYFADEERKVHEAVYKARFGKDVALEPMGVRTAR